MSIETMQSHRSAGTSGKMQGKRVVLTALAVISLGCAGQSGGAEPSSSSSPAPFTGEKTTWHGFDRYDFLMDSADLSLKPFKAPPAEKSAVGSPPTGHRRCTVVTPKEPAPGRPWSWRGCYWDHQPQTEIELLKRGFHVAYISADATLKPGKEWAAWFDFLTEQHGLSKKPSFVGMSRGGEYAYVWATAHPDKVSCIYADNPGGNREVLARLGDLASNEVPLPHVCGSLDPWLESQTRVAEKRYKELGGRITVIAKEGEGHFPTAPRETKPVVDFITARTQ